MMGDASSSIVYLYFYDDQDAFLKWTEMSSKWTSQSWWEFFFILNIYSMLVKDISLMYMIRKIIDVWAREFFFAN